MTFDEEIEKIRWKHSVLKLNNGGGFVCERRKKNKDNTIPLYVVKLDKTGRFQARLNIQFPEVFILYSSSRPSYIQAGDYLVVFLEDSIKIIYDKFSFDKKSKVICSLKGEEMEKFVKFIRDASNTKKIYKMVYYENTLLIEKYSQINQIQEEYSNFSKKILIERGIISKD